MIYLLIPAGILALLLFLPWTRNVILSSLAYGLENLAEHLYEHHPIATVWMMVLLAWSFVLLILAGLVFLFTYLLSFVW